MPKTLRYLIMTADERTWKFDRPVIFLGDWCRRYDRKHIWQNMDAIVAQPYGLGQTQKDADYAEARDLEDKLFLILCDALNHHHDTQHGARFWRIVLGHWLRRYVDVILNRVRTLERCLQAHQLSGTTAFSVDRYVLAPLDSNSAIWAFNDDRWNNALYTRILDLLGVTDCPTEVIISDKSEGFRWHEMKTASLQKRRVLRWFRQQAGKLAGFLARENDAFIINSYLPKKEEIKLQLALGQVPQLWTTTQLQSINKSNQELRLNLGRRITEKTSDTLFRILCSQVFELLPVTYLEGFADVSEKSQKLNWPKKPKFIFTSNNFDTDEGFKIWAATKVESGSKYVVGQHGNNYGTYRYMRPSIEETTADKFITWGWSDGLQQHMPGFIFKTAGQKEKSHDLNGGVLLVEATIYHHMNSWDRSHEFELFFADQVAFIAKLEKTLREKLTVRLHHSYKYFKSFELDRWHDFDPALTIEPGTLPIQKLISQNRLIIHSYDSTGLLETLAQNIPTLAFWKNDLDHLRDSAIPYYQVLVDAGIVHFTAKSVAEKTNEIWEDVECWWSQHAVQEARKKFCNRYAKVSQNPVCDLKDLLQRWCL